MSGRSAPRSLEGYTAPHPKAAAAPRYIPPHRRGDGSWSAESGYRGYGERAYRGSQFQREHDPYCDAVGATPFLHVVPPPGDQEN